jgi:hypothetical protein
VTSTFFPVNIIILAFFPLILGLRSNQINDFVLKIQYVIMVLIYLLFFPVMLALLVPMLYFKMIGNSFYIFFNKHREHYRGESIVNLFIAVVLGLPVICVSLLIDFITLPGILLRDEENLEKKYQKSEQMTVSQTVSVLSTF